jgi:hypothetical protein
VAGAGVGAAAPRGFILCIVFLSLLTA